VQVAYKTPGRGLTSALGFLRFRARPRVSPDSALSFLAGQAVMDSRLAALAFAADLGPGRRLTRPRGFGRMVKPRTPSCFARSHRQYARVGPHITPPQGVVLTENRQGPAIRSAQNTDGSLVAVCDRAHVLGNRDAYDVVEQPIHLLSNLDHRFS
jgi:hypothetical protein